jgi:hypothetical protein
MRHNETKPNQAGELTQQEILTCDGAGRRQAFIRGYIEIGYGATNEVAIQSLLGKMGSKETERELPANRARENYGRSVR